MSRQLDLMRLYDGELTPDEARELERTLTPDERAVLAGLEQVGSVVRAAEPDAVARFEGVADQVLAALEQAEVRPIRPEVAVESKPARSQRQRAKSAPVVALGLALAAAAAAALWLTTPRAPEALVPVASPVRPAPPPAVPGPPSESPAEETEDELDPAATIEAVDFGNQPGSIFMVPAGQASTPVVWLEDEPVGARMEPL